MEQLIGAAGMIVGGTFGCVLWLWISNAVLDLLLRKGGHLRRAGVLRPWLFLGPAVLLMGMYLAYPALCSLWLSLKDADGMQWAGGTNYRWLAQDPKFREALRNTLLWLALVPAMTTALGLLAARLTVAARWGGLATVLILMPVAMSFTGAGVIWKFVYEYRATGQAQTGLLNAVIVSLGGAAQNWLSQPGWNNLCLMAVLVWAQTGFAMVLLQGALRRIPQDILDAAVLDGATPWQAFFRIQLPHIRGAIMAVWTAVTVVALKVFDIVHVMTNGQWGTQVLANLMYDWMFRGAPDYGRGSAIAVVLMALMMPMMIANLRRAGA